MKYRVLLNVLLVVAAVLDVILVFAALGSLPRDVALPSASIRPDEGRAYVVRVNALTTRLPFTVYSDSIESPRASTLVLREDGRQIGPAHASHSDIRTAGSGAYSHWRGMLYFSAPDGSDPRSNGRAYTVRAEVTLHPLVLALALALTAGLIGYRLQGSSGERRRQALDWGLVLAGGLFAVVIVAAASGLLPPMNQNAGPPKDVALAIAIALHLLLGSALFVISVLLSAAFGRLQIRSETAPLPELVLAGYPGALVVLAIAAAVTLASPLGHLGGIAVLLAGCVPLLGGRPVPRGDLGHLARVVTLALPATFAFAGFMALLWHGPTATLQASTQGDLVHSYASLHVLSVAPWPLRHFGSEGDFLPYDNMLPMALGATLTGLPGFDGMLFLTASIAVFFGLWLALGLACLRRLSTGVLPPALAGCLILLTLAAVRTPSFIVESPPVPFMAPLLFSFVLLARRNSGVLVASVLNAVIVAMSTALTKVVMLVPLGLLTIYDIVSDRRMRRLTRSQLLAIGVAVLVVGLYVLRTLSTWGASYWYAYVPGPDSRIWLSSGQTGNIPALLAVAARDLGWCVLGFAAFKSGPPRLAAAVFAAIAANFFYPYLFHTTSVFAPLLIVAMLALEPQRYQSTLRLLLLACALLLPYPLLRDWAGLQSGLIWAACIGQVALLSAPGTLNAAAGSWAERRLPLATAALGGMALLAIGEQLLIVDSGWRQGKADVLTATMHDIWHAVRRETPPDALIFTDQTGPEFRVASGWNSYAATGQRQVFIASWVTSFRRFRIDPDARAARLQQNADVIEGRIAASRAVTSRSYGGYFAVIDARRPAPAGFQRIYENQDFALYRIM